MSDMNEAVFQVPCAVQREGGPWLAAVRNRIQTMFRNGETVAWGSGEVPDPHPTVRQMEELAAHAVAADRNERVRRTQEQ